MLDGWEIFCTKHTKETTRGIKNSKLTPDRIQSGSTSVADRDRKAKKSRRVSRSSSPPQKDFLRIAREVKYDINRTQNVSLEYLSRACVYEVRYA